MSGGRNRSFGWRLGVGVMLAGLALICFAEHHIRYGIVITGLGFAPYIAVLAPFQCRELTTKKTACTLRRWGWFLGCGYHFMRRLRRVFSVASGGRVAATSRPLGVTRSPKEQVATGVHELGLMPAKSSNADPARRVWRDRVDLAVSVIGMLAGVIALFHAPG